MTRKPTKRGKKPTTAAKNRSKPDSPQIGFLTPEEFEAIGRAALGGRGWQRALRRGTGIAQTTITRYLRGIFPIPKTIALIMNMLQTLRNNGLPIPSEFFDDDEQKGDET